MNKENWIPEAQACALLGYSSPARFRRNVKDRKNEIQSHAIREAHSEYEMQLEWETELDTQMEERQAELESFEAETYEDMDEIGVL